KTIWVQTAADKVIQFNPDKEAVSAIKSYFNASIAAGGPEAIAALKRSGLRDLGIGVAAALLGIGLTVASLMHPTEDAQGGSKSTILYGLVLFGLIWAGKGIYTLVRAAKIQV